MELQIQDLVASIRKEGIDSANTEAEKIISDAVEKAAKIVTRAQKEAEDVKRASEQEISILSENAAASVRQAKRDAVLAFKAEVETEFEKILSARIRSELSGDSLGKLIRSAIAGEDLRSYTVEVSEVNDSLRAELAEEIRCGLEIRPTKSVQAGFRLAAKDGSGYFDCSDEEIMQMLTPYFRELDF